MRISVVSFIALILNVNICLGQSKFGMCYDLIGSNGIQTGFQVSGSCQQDVFEPAFSLPVEFVNNTVRSIVKIPGCSATIVSKIDNNTQDPEYYIVTARHCIHKDITPNQSPLNQSMGLGPLLDLSETTIIFNGSKSSLSSPKPCIVNHKMISSLTLIDESLENDMALLKIDGFVPPHFKPYFAGWSAAKQNPFSGDYYILHHPKSDVKKVTRVTSNEMYDGRAAIPLFLFAGFPPAILTAFLGLTSGLVDKYYLDLDVNEGLVEQGSSGSGLFNEDSYLIGTDSWGTVRESSCNDADKFEAFGKFRRFFLNSQAVRDALVGSGSSIIGMSGKELVCYDNLYNLSGDYWAGSSYQPNNAITLSAANDITTYGNLEIKPDGDFTFTAGNSITLNPGFDTQNMNRYEAKIEGCINSSFREVQSFEYMTDEDIAYIDSLEANGITRCTQDSLAWHEIMSLYYPEILSNPDSAALYWSYVGCSTQLAGTRLSKPTNSNNINVTVSPNPLSEGATLIYNMNTEEFLELSIYNSYGQRLFTVANGVMSKGIHRKFLNAEDLPAGVYYLNVKTRTSLNTQRMIIVK